MSLIPLNIARYNFRRLVASIGAGKKCMKDKLKDKYDKVKLNYLTGC